MAQSPALIESAMLWPRDRFDADDQVLCLNFVNTVSWRGKPEPSDHMATPEAWVAWIASNKALPSEALAELKRRASMWPFEAEAAFGRAVEFRESLYLLLRSFLRGETSSEKSTLDDLLARAVERVQLSEGKEGWNWNFEAAPVDWETPLYPVALSAAQLLTSVNARKLRVCERDECLWLFIDGTKNHSRKWCDMTSCGNVMKARRSYAKRRQGPTARRARSKSLPR